MHDKSVRKSARKSATVILGYPSKMKEFGVVFKQFSKDFMQIH